MAEKKKRRRLFLALWPDDLTRKKLADVQQQFCKNERLKSARPVAVSNIHITMHFLGAVSEDVHTRLDELLCTVEASVFTLVIDCWGYFPRAKVLWLGAATTPDTLADLVEQTQTCIQQCVDGYEQRRFVSHVTLFRKARHPMKLDDFHPIEWHIDRFALVESVTHPEGPEYRVLKEWRLN